MTHSNPQLGGRIVRDSQGEMEVPADALWGASTARAVANFPISGERFSRRFVRALGLVKAAAAATNAELGVGSDERRALRAAGVVAGPLSSENPD